MTCRHARDFLDAYATESLHGPMRAEIAEHLRGCASCRADLSHIHAVAARLRDTPVPPMPEGLAARLVRTARARDEAARRPAGVQAAIAATLVIGVGIGLETGSWLRSERTTTTSAAAIVAPATVAAAVPAGAVPAAPAPAAPMPAAPMAVAASPATRAPATSHRTLASTTPEPASPEITIAVDAEQTVALEFNAARALKGVEFVITIPEGFQLAGHENAQRIAWHGDLHAGRNRLNLRLKAAPGSAGVLVARVAHQGHDHALEIRLRAA